MTHKSVEGSLWNPIRWIQRSASGIQLERLDPVGGADQPASTEMSQVLAWKLSFLMVNNTKCYKEFNMATFTTAFGTSFEGFQFTMIL